MKDVIIEIHSVQDGIETSFLYTEGFMTEKDNNIFIEFDGTEVCGMDGEKYKLEINGQEKVTMVSGNGNYKSQLILEKGVKHFCQYCNMGGDVLVGVDAQSINSTLGKSGGDLEVKYILDVNHSVSSTNVMKVKVNIN